MVMVHPAPEATCPCSFPAGTEPPLSRLGTATPAAVAPARGHAAVAPDRGRNAADARTVAQVAAGLLPQHLELGQMVHGIVAHGGAAPNTVPANISALYYLRAPDIESSTYLETRVRVCFAVGAVATGYTHKVTQMPLVSTQLVPDPWLVSVYRVAITEFGRSPSRPEDERVCCLGSADMGNASSVLPMIHPTIAIDCGEAVNHQPEFTSACATSSADRAVCDGAPAVALTGLAAAADDAQRDRSIGGMSRRRTAPGPTAGGVA